MYSMRETCQMAGLTYGTLKYYCNEGLVPGVKRDKNNYRVFDQRTVNWIKSLSCLKGCGMSIIEMKSYLALCLEGESSIAERKVMLNEKRESLTNHINELNSYIDYIDHKNRFYDDVTSKKIKYESNLIY
ncbi:MAG: MerR family transcriptional regulator [Streptococcaceae bacterium]|jgi:DNA-binding transcriptional MerR regulator|nr:MerR family transcriptional regulator [Streptococcaceae bacterium]MCH4176240.1 MerR family transcriptional regulator [Streptococcaceae bacterium]